MIAISVKSVLVPGPRFMWYLEISCVKTINQKDFSWTVQTLRTTLEISPGLFCPFHLSYSVIFFHKNIKIKQVEQQGVIVRFYLIFLTVAAMNTT